MGEVKEQFIEQMSVGRSMVSASNLNIFYDILILMPERGVLLDVGTCLGDSATFFAEMKQKWSIFTFDYFGLIPVQSYNQVDAPIHGFSENDREKVFSTLSRYPNIFPVVGNTQVLQWRIPAKFIIIDWDFTYEEVRRYFELFSPSLQENGKIVFHDYGVDQKGVDIRKFINELIGWKKEIINDLAIIWR